MDYVYWNSSAPPNVDVMSADVNVSSVSAAAAAALSWASPPTSSWAPPSSSMTTTTTTDAGGVGGLSAGLSRYSAAQTCVLAVVLGFLTVGTIVGNILVCVAVCMVRKLRKPSNYLLVSLAVSDFCVGVLVMPMAAVYELSGAWPLGRILCDMWVALDVLGCAASILNLCMISVDRYFAITKPLKYGVKRTPKRMLVYIAVVWLGAAAISIPPPVILGNEHGTESQRECVVCQNFWYQILATLGSFYIPLIVMIVVYSRIFKAAKRITNEEKKSQIYMNSRQSLVAGNAEAVNSGRAVVGAGSNARRMSCIENSFAAAATVGGGNGGGGNNKTAVSVVASTTEKSARNGSARRTSSYCLNMVTSSSSNAPHMGALTNSSRLSDSDDSRRCSDGSGRLFGQLHHHHHPHHQHQPKSYVRTSLSCGPAVGPGAGERNNNGSSLHQHLTGRGSQGTKMKLFLSSERKASATLGIIMSAFVICWLPFFVLAVVRPFVPAGAIPYPLTSFFLWLGYANSFLNPVIYATLNKDFRTPFREILCFRCRSLQGMMREEFYHSQYGEPAPTEARRHLYSTASSQHYQETARLTALSPNETVL